MSVSTSLLSYVQPFGTPWTVAHQAPLSVGFSRQEYWSRWPFPPPADRPDPGMEPSSPVSLAKQVTGFFTARPCGKPWDKARTPANSVSTFVHYL